MFRHYLLTTFRNLWRRKLYSVITLLSLTIGLSIFSVIFLHVKWEFSYNRGIKDSARVFQLYTSNADSPFAQVIGGSDFSTAHSKTDTNALREFLGSSVAGYTRTNRLTAYDRSGETQRYINLMAVEEGFSDVFSLPVVEGSINQVHMAPGNIALEESIAEILFGDRSAVGQIIELAGGQSASAMNGAITVNEGETLEFQVVAVFSQPQPLTTELNITAIADMNDYTGRLSPGRSFNSSVTTWLKLRKQGDADQIQNDLATYVDQYLQQPTGDQAGQARSDVNPYLIRSIEDIYFQSQGDLTRILSFGLLGLLVMIAGCSNAVSLGFASALERTREVGIRKSVGAERSHVMTQFLGEPVMLAFFSMIPVLVITGVYHPAFAQMLSFPQLPALVPGDYALLAAIILLVGFSIGFYPAFILSRLRPVQILRPQTRKSGTNVFSLRSIMVGVQFSLAILLLVVTVSLYSQLLVSRSVSLGFNTDNLANIFISNENSDIGPEALKNLIQQMPGVVDVIETASRPNTGERNDAFYAFSRTTDAAEQVSATLQNIPAGQFGMYEIPLLAGREFIEDRDGTNNNADQQERNSPVIQKAVINRSLMKALLIESPEEAIGTRLYRFLSLANMNMDSIPVEVIGVVEDSMYGGIRSRPGPEIYFYNNDISSLMRALNSASQLTVRYDSSLEGDLQNVMSDYLLREAGIEMMAVTFLEELVRVAYRTEIRESRLLLLCGFLALVLSCSGMYGLVSISMKARIKEVGIRKALGATSLSILSTILKSYSWPVLLANILAWPVAVYFVLQWIKGFPYQLDKAWLLPICLGTSVLVLIIAWVTVSVLTYKTASAKPVLALRYE